MIKENTVTTKVRELLSGMTHGWTFLEQRAAFVSNQRTPDILAMRDGRETVAIEAKAHNKDIADAVDELRTDYFGQRLKPLYQRVSPTLTAGLALRYPKAVQNIDDDALEHALIHTDAIDYCVVTADGEGNFPKSGYATGSLRDIATALHIGASPTKKIAEVAEVYSEGMEAWSKDIERSICCPRCWVSLTEIPMRRCRIFGRCCAPSRRLLARRSLPAIWKKNARSSIWAAVR